MSAAPRAVFRCDASASIGGGHLRRCLTLAGGLSAKGWQVVFAVRGETLSATPTDLPQLRGWIVLDGSGENEAQQIAAALGRQDVDLVVVDHYRLDRAFERSCRGFARRIAVIDDLADRRHDADLLLDQTFGRGESDYLGLVPKGCTCLCGSRYALLRPAFAERRESALARRAAGGRVRRILIAMGATDAADLSSLAIDAATRVAERLDRPLALDIVLGAGAPHLSTIRRRLVGLPAWDIHVDAPGNCLARLMASADLAIGAAGTTSWERCCLGLPGVVVVAADNQAKIAAELAAAGACQVASADAAEDIAAAVAALCGDDGARLAMAEAAASVCDGEGTARVVEAIEAMVACAPSRQRPTARERCGR
jgi:UDP-2,4-diacetamido-2,4,6-trideoxy-beta-L-altropyranose hydrolase